MTILYRNDFMTLSLVGETLTFVWHREEPDDDHAVATAEEVRRALVAFADAHPSQSFKVMIDLGPAQKTFPRGTATYAAILAGNRPLVRRGAFVTKSFLLRAAISSTFLGPGLLMKGFTDIGAASVFVSMA